MDTQVFEIIYSDPKVKATCSLGFQHNLRLPWLVLGAQHQRSLFYSAFIRNFDSSCATFALSLFRLFQWFDLLNLLLQMNYVLPPLEMTLTFGCVCEMLVRGKDSVCVMTEE